MKDFRSGEGKTTKISYINRNNQRCEGTRGKEGNDHMQYSYKIVCQNCEEIYGANGSDIFQRKCPNCQGGSLGIDF
jgi:Zn finger protein HypA/HybF involved in hydrogenase expression